MRSVTTQPWQAALTRWSDPVFGLTLLLHDNRAAAEQHTVAVLARNLPGDAATLETRLYKELLRTERWYQRRRRMLLPARFRQHVLSSPLVSLRPSDRVLLALWLLQGVNGVRLAEIAGIEVDALVKRLAGSLVALFDQRITLDESNQPAFEAWLGRQMQADGARRGPATDRAGSQPAEMAAWLGVVEAARAMLRAAVGNQHVPLSCLDAIAAEILDHGDLPRWWQHRVVWLVGLIGGVGLLLLFLIAPWQRSGSATTTTQTSPQAIVRQALEAWTAPPQAGILHRRVWARTTWPTDEPLVTEIWLAAESSRHRVEVRRGDTLVEWQLSDGRSRFEYAAQPNMSSCRWAEPSTSDRLIRAFTLSATEQRAVRDARLTLGAYGQGYQLLQQALAADDLRSYGKRSEGNTTLLALGLNDRQVSYERQLILWIEPQRGTLHLIQELTGAEGTSASRELWRLQVQDTSQMSVPMKQPEWDRSLQTRDALLDPACPGLDGDHVLSLRTLIVGSMMGWGQNYMPTQLPPGTTHAALLSSSRVADLTNASGNIRTVFIGPGRRLSLSSLPQRSDVLPTGIQQGDWKVVFDEQALDTSGTACRVRETMDICMPLLRFSASGWSHDELVSTMASLKPLDEAMWLAYDRLFLEPRPLAPDVAAAFARTIKAQQPPQGERLLHNLVEWTVRVNPDRPDLRDPYHVPVELLEPERLTQEQWLVYSDTALVQYKELNTLPNGELYSGRVNDGVKLSEYYVGEGVARINRNPPDAWWIEPPLPPAMQLVRTYLNSTLPITGTEAAGTLQLEQQVPINRENHIPAFIGPLAAWTGDLPPGVIVRRLWLDTTTQLPQRTETLHSDAQGRETVLSTMRLIEWRYLDAREVALSLPPLPPDIIQVNPTPRGLSIIGGDLDLGALTRFLMWPAASGLVVEQDENPQGIGPSIGIGNDPRLERAIYTPIQLLESLNLIKVTTYGLPEQDVHVTVRQGPRGLLRHVLRHVAVDDQAVSAPRGSSRQLTVSIGGKQYEAWLLEDDTTAALVVEVDKVLLYITGTSPTYLAEQLPAELAKLEWVDVEN